MLMMPTRNRSLNAVPNRRIRRRITPQAGRALEILAHAIEYLEDMHRDEGSLLVWEKAQMEAIEILKKLNREIYAECPVVPSLDERLYSLIGRIFKREDR